MTMYLPTFLIGKTAAQHKFRKKEKIISPQKSTKDSHNLLCEFLLLSMYSVFILGLFLAGSQIFTSQVLATSTLQILIFYLKHFVKH